MKESIEQVARDASEKAGCQPKIAADLIDRTIYECGFRAGVNFAQQWYSVEDVEVGKTILLKNDLGDVSTGYFTNGSFVIDAEMASKKIVEWRNIELK